MDGNGGAGAPRKVTLIPGDGIGPEIIDATRRIIDAAGARIEWEERDAGESVFLRGLPSGVPPETIASISDTRVALKGPLGTPIGYGEKSANVTLRKLFETYGNLRPVREMPGVTTPYSGRGIDLIVVRENVEDLYAGIEHQQTPGVAQCLKLISHKGCEKIARLAFEVARAEGRSSVACMTKSNIMKLTEGQLKRVFEEVAEDYPDIESWHVIIDNGAHQLVKKPEQYDVIVTTNMNGDIISDLTSALVGGLGFAPSANLGNDVAIFEAVHGTAPKYAGKDVINPTSMILSGVMMLRHIGEFGAASAIEHAIMVTLEDGTAMTRDVVGDELAAGTTAYTDAIIANLGRESAGLVGPRVPADLTPARHVLPGRRDRGRATGRRRRRVRRVRRGGPRARPEPRAAERGFRPEAQDDLEPGDEGLSAHGRHHRLRRPLAVPLRGARGRGRPRRRRRPRPDPPRRLRAPLDAHREAPGVRRRAGVHQGAGRGLTGPPAPPPATGAAPVDV